MRLADRARLDQRRIFASGFTESVTIAFASGEQVGTNGIWFEGAELVEAGDYLQVSSSKPSIVVLRNELPGKPRAEDDRVCFCDQWFTVADCEPLHPGMWRIRLHKESA